MTFPSNSSRKLPLNDILLSSMISHQRFFALITDCRAFFCAANFSENVLRGKSFRNDKKSWGKISEIFINFQPKQKKLWWMGAEDNVLILDRGDENFYRFPNFREKRTKRENFLPLWLIFPVAFVMEIYFKLSSSSAGRARLRRNFQFLNESTLRDGNSL